MLLVASCATLAVVAQEEGAEAPEEVAEETPTEPTPTEPTEPLKPPYDFGDPSTWPQYAQCVPRRPRPARRAGPHRSAAQVRL